MNQSHGEGEKNVYVKRWTQTLAGYREKAHLGY